MSLCAKVRFARIYQEIIFECFDVAEKFLDGVFLLVEREEFRYIRIQTIHILEHILQDLVWSNDLS